MRKFLLCFITLFLLKNSYAQDFSNKGKEFWVPYSYHVGMVIVNSAIQMTLSITSDVTTTYTVEIYGGATIATGTVTANTISYVTVPNTYFLDDDGLFNGKAVHVVAAKPVVVYSFITRALASAATLCLPTTVLGKQYYSVNYDQRSNENSSNSYITVIGVEDNTTVEIIPKVATKGGWAAGSINTITLNKGQIYQVLGTTNGLTGGDLSGTSIRSIASALGSCKRIAVFSGSGKVLIGGPTCTNGADNLYQQLYPVGTWGKNFLTVPSYQNPNNYYRIMLSTTTAVVKLNGVVIPAASFVNGYYTFFNNLQNKIEADEPICVSQYFTSQGCGGNTGTLYDPDMIVLNPVEQNISNVTLASINKLAANSSHLHTVHVIIPNTGTAISSFLLDGVSPGDVWTVHPQNPNYSYAYFSNLTETSHNIRSDSGFNAIAYGYAANETYAYSAGTNVKDLYQQIGTQSQYGIETSPSVCTGSPFKFKMSLPYQADSMYWDLSPVHPAVWIKRVPPADLPYDSIRTINGKQVWWYSLPNTYTYNTIGTYPITIKVYAPNADGCGNENEINFDLEVSDPPVADFTYTTPRCIADTVQFTDNTNSVKPTYKWVWNFGDPASGANNTSTLKNPKHRFVGTGPFPVTYSNITTPGCLSNVIQKSITIAPMPTAAVTTSVSSVCLNGTAPTVTFTGSGGSAPYTFTYTINGALPAQTVTTTGTANTATVPVPLSAPGTVRYALTNVQNTGSSLCFQSQSGFKDLIIRPLPTATISGTASVCQTGTPPNITFTAANATAPYTFTYTINGGAPQTVTTTTGNSVSVAVPTANTGPFVYSLVSVKEGSADACVQNISAQTATVTIIPLPTATLTGNATVCQNSPSPSITFTGSGGTAPYTFTYNIDGGANQTITSTGNSASLSIPTTNTGSHTYTISLVRDATANLCSNTVTGQAVTIRVNPLPSGTISGTTSVCQNSTSPNITFTGSGTVAPYTFTYTVNGGAQQTITTTTGNTVTLPAPTTNAIPLVYNLIKVNDGTPQACGKDITGQSATVTVRPLPTATIAGTVTVCKDAAPQTITFTGATGTAPYKFTYNINGGTPQTITTTGTNTTATVTVATGTPGTYAYNLTGIIDASSNTCSNTITGQTATVTVKALPTATIATNITELCLNTTAPTITFTGAGGTPPYRFTYQINGGASIVATTAASSSSVTVSAPATAPGTFVYTLTNVAEGSASLCSQAVTGQSVSVLVNPLPVANFTYSTPSCETRIITFNSSSSVANAGTITSWAWNFDDATSGAANTSTLQNPTHVYATSGTHNVTLKVTTNKGCVSIVKSIPVIINPRPKAGFIVPEVCLLDPYAEFTDTSKIAGTGTITAWEWNFDDAANSTGANPNTSTQQNPRHRFTQVRSYTIRLIAISNNGCRDTTTNTIFINDGNPVGNFALAPANNYCSNDTIAILNKSTITQGVITKLDVVWDLDGAPGVVETDETPVFDRVYKHKYPEFQSPLTKPYRVRVRAYSGQTCFNDKIISITINATPKISFAPIPDGCIDVPPYQITQATEIGGVPGVGVYSGPGITFVSPGVYNFSPAAAGAGTHKIRYVFTSNAGCVDSDSANVTVYPNPVVDAGPDVTILAGGSITLQPTVTGNDLRYLWSPAQYLNSATIKNPLASPPADFTYKLTVTGRGGCIASDDLNIKVLMAPKIPNTFTPNSDGINDFWKIEYLDTYPNCKVQVFSRTGTLVFESRGYRKPWDGNMGGKSLPADTYYYIIEPESGRKPITGYVTIIK